jgi:Protein of unknown function (DUF3551)
MRRKSESGFCADIWEDMNMKLHRLPAAAMAATVLAALLILAAPAQAQTYDPRYPVCLQIYQSMVDYYFECAYTSIPQCQMSASGRNASCVVNPYYGGPKAKRSKKQPRPY